MGHDGGDSEATVTGDGGDSTGRERHDAMRGAPSAEAALRELAERRAAAQRQLERSADLREQARRVLDRTTPEERQRMQRWADMMSREGRTGEGDLASTAPREPDGGREIVDRDMTRGDATGELLAEWFDDAPHEPGERREVAPAQQERFDAARRAAERAVESTSVPPRYHRLLRRYFSHLGEAPDASTTAPAQPGATAPSAPGSTSTTPPSTPAPRSN